MYWDYSSPTITNCLITDNSAPNGGGWGFAIDSYPVLTNCVFSGNGARDSGGGLSVIFGGRVKLTNCLFTDNHAGDQGGAINVGQAEIEMVNCNLSGNDSGRMGGGINVSSSDLVDMTNCLVEDNSAAGEGGGFYFWDSSTSMLALNSRIRSNTAPSGPDGYIYGSIGIVDVILRCCDADPDMWVGEITMDNEGCE